MYKYSVIIPHKNCPDLLSRCVNSIPNKDDIEIIVIDDNSIDLPSLKRLEVENRCKNIHFEYTTEGKGAGYARNVGLSMATGCWLIFADADDFFTKEAFDIFDKYANSDYDIIYFKHTSVFSNTLEPCQRYNVRDRLIESYLSNKTGESELKLRYKDVVPWSKMFRRSISSEKNVLFDEVPASNDVMFVVRNAFYARQVYASTEIVYTSTYRDGSITRVANKENNMSRFRVGLKYNLFVKKMGHSELSTRVFSHVMLALRTFGIKEAVRYIVVAHQNRQWLFSGGVPGLNELLGKICKKKGLNTFRG